MIQKGPCGKAHDCNRLDRPPILAGAKKQYGFHGGTECLFRPLV